MYLAALKAGAVMAEYLGEIRKAKEYLEIFSRGKRWVEENLFNGEYFYQLIDLKDKSILEKYSSTDPNVVSAYWDDEHKEIKYQIGEGCEIDQVLSQWHANICGLGEIFDGEKVKRALKSIYKYNFKRSMRNHFNPCRIFSLNDEAGAVICEWPVGRKKPIIPVPYAEETMSGFEYAVASLMIQEGLVDEALEIVKAIRDRYDGEKRNPWNEIECGSNYVRSMSSYALLLAYSGFKIDMVKGEIEFNPSKIQNGEFKCFWSAGTGWGVFEINRGKVLLTLKYGYLWISVLSLPFLEHKKISSVLVNGKEVEYRQYGSKIFFAKPIFLDKEASLTILTIEPE